MTLFDSFIELAALMGLLQNMDKSGTQKALAVVG
jgi:hypothetical protein